MKRRILLLSSLFMVLLSAAVMASPLDAIGNFFGGLFGAIGTLSFLGGSADQFAGFLRILYTILVAYILYLGGSNFLSDHISRRSTIILSILLAVMASFLTPASMIIAITASFSGIIAFALAGAIWGGIIFSVVRSRTHTWGSFLMKTGAILLGFWVAGQWAFFLNKNNLNPAEFSAGTAFAGSAFGNVIDTMSEWAYIIFVILLLWVLIDFIFLRPRQGGDRAGWGQRGAGAAARRGGLRGLWDRFTGGGNNPDPNQPAGNNDNGGGNVPARARDEAAFEEARTLEGLQGVEAALRDLTEALANMQADIRNQGRGLTDEHIDGMREEVARVAEELNGVQGNLGDVVSEARRLRRDLRQVREIDQDEQEAFAAAQALRGEVRTMIRALSGISRSLQGLAENRTQAGTVNQNQARSTAAEMRRLHDDLEELRGHVAALLEMEQHIREEVEEAQEE